MTFGTMDWVEVGDEWWFYYSAYDGPHGTSERDGQIGLAKLRKEGFISMRGPAGGGVLVTRPIRWPGGDLVVNSAWGDFAIWEKVRDAASAHTPCWLSHPGRTSTGAAAAAASPFPKV